MRALSTMLAALCVAAMTLAAPRTARAMDVWRTPFPGVRHLHRVERGLDYHVVLVDLRDPRVELVATRPADRSITVTEFARRSEADLAINANFFNHGSCGLMAGGGEVMQNAYDDNCSASLGFGRENEAAVFDSLEIPRGPVPSAWMTEALTGKPFLLRDGRAPNWVRPQHLYRPNPRTAVGLTRDRRTLVMLVADGRRGDAAGLTGFQMVAVLREFAVTDAINLDGGGSTALVMGGRVQNRPSDGHERVVISHLGVRVHEGAEWYAAEVVDRSATAVARAGELVGVWLDVRNLGRAAWHGPGEGPAGSASGSPVLELDDGLVRHIATVRETASPGEVGRFEVTWQARGRGLRHLRARLVAPDGTSVDLGPLVWDVAVRRDDRVSPAAQRASAVARASELVLPAGLGGVTVRAGNCSVRRGEMPGRRALLASFVVLAALAVARGRRAGRP
ncbi:MAG: phosphodiester glycosidase family protein [Deltaproteobacteria bacterium]